MLPIPLPLMDERDRRLYALLMLRELGSCTHMQLLHFAFENDIMSYFDLSLALTDLVDAGTAARTAHPADSLYVITPAGLEQLSFFASRLPNSKVTLIKESAPPWKERFQREKQFVAKLTQSPSGEYMVHLRLTDGNDTMLSIDIPVPERSLADRMAANWPERAGELYQRMMLELGEGRP